MPRLCWFQFNYGADRLFRGTFYPNMMYLRGTSEVQIFLFTNKNGVFEQKSVEYGIDDTLQNARGAALADILYRGNLDIIVGNWNGFHRIYVKKGNSFLDFSNDNFGTLSDTYSYFCGLRQ